MPAPQVDSATLAAWDEEAAHWLAVADAAACADGGPDGAAWARAGGLPRLVAGLDVAYGVDDSGVEHAMGCLVALRLPGLQRVGVDYEPAGEGEHGLPCTATGLPPYVPGYLGFRERDMLLPLMARALAWDEPPELFLLDAFGALHPRRLGAATMLGAAAGVPTAGTAKSLLLARGVPPERAVRAAGGEALEWDVVGGEGEGGVVVARAVRAHPGVVAPVYASAGFRVGLDAAARVVRACCVHRVPEPVRLADQAGRVRLKAALASLHTCLHS